MKCAHYSKRMLCKQDCIKFCGRTAWQSFFENNFCRFLHIVQVKKNQDFVQPLVASPISNISYYTAVCEFLLIFKHLEPMKIYCTLWYFTCIELLIQWYVKYISQKSTAYKCQKRCDSMSEHIYQYTASKKVFLEFRRNKDWEDYRILQ